MGPLRPGTRRREVDDAHPDPSDPTGRGLVEEPSANALTCTCEDDPLRFIDLRAGPIEHRFDGAPVFEVSSGEAPAAFSRRSRRPPWPGARVICSDLSPELPGFVRESGVGDTLVLPEDAEGFEPKSVVPHPPGGLDADATEAIDLSSSSAG